MPDYELKRINALTEKTSLGDADMLAVDSASGTRKVSGETVKALIDEKIEAWAETGTVANANQLISKQGVVDHVPYFFRTSGGSKDIGDRKYEKLVGGSVGWNQLVNTGDTSVTVQSGHKYYSVISGTKSIGSSNGTAISVTGGTDIVIDLTLALGSTIADYLYTLEQATAGAGVAKLKSWGFCTKDYYAYDAGSMQSASASKMVTVGFNAYNPDTGKAHVVGGHEYQITGAYTALSLDGTTITPVSGKFTPSHDGELTVTGGNASTTCIHLRWSGYRDGEYEPYSKHEYALDSDLVLRGIPKLDDNNELYYDGDTYESDGTVTRRYGIVDLGTLEWVNGSTSQSGVYRKMGPLSDAKFAGDCLCAKYVTVTAIDTYRVNLGIAINNNSAQVTVYDPSYSGASDIEAFKTAMSGVYLVYELATPTTETAEPFTNPQIVDDFGTEEYVTTGIVPVGHVTQYANNLRAKLEMAPDSPDADGYYVVHHEDGENAYVALPAEIPSAPAENGTYVLKCTVSSGTPTLTWVSE